MAETFECPICYTDGIDSGSVNPTCTHKLCLSCYSKILLIGGTNAKCPFCRLAYLKMENQEMLEDLLNDQLADFYPIAFAPRQMHMSF